MIALRRTAAGALVLLIVALLPLALACKKKSADEEGAPSASATVSNAGWYLGVISGKGADIPFFLHLPRDSERARILNGQEEIAARHRWTDKGVEVDFEMYKTKITAAAESDGLLVGRWASSSGSWGNSILPFRATRVSGPSAELRFGPSDADASWVGIWKLTFAEDSGVARLRLDRSATGELTAFLQFHTGNSTFLAGHHTGNRAKLSAFDGTSPYLLVIERNGNELSGSWLAGQDLGWKEAFTGVRAGDFTLPPEVGEVAKARPKLTLPQLDDPRYRGKPVLVELAASWCPACGPAASYLSELYGRYHPQGLEIITLTYELTNDSAYNRRQAEVFKQQLGLPWDVIAVDGEDYSAILPAELEGANPTGFPTAVFVARDGTVSAVHAGFPSSAARAELEAVKAFYERSVAAIVKK